MKRSCVYSSVLLSCLTLLALGAGGPEPAATAPDKDTAQLHALIKNLGAAEFSTREDAQRQLSLLPLSKRDLLAALVDQSTDPEIQMRLRKAIDKMDEQSAINPPPISLDVKNASTKDVVALLNKAVGGNFVAPDLDTDTYTLKLVDQPFWEVLRQLSAQHPLWLGPDGKALIKSTCAHMQIDRGIVLTADAPKRIGNNTLTLKLAVALDPRVVVFDLRPIEVTDARDDQGHSLPLVTDDLLIRMAALRSSMNNMPHYQSQDLRFTAADPLGKSLTIKGQVSLVAQVTSNSVTIANAVNNLHFVVGDSVVTFKDMIKGGPGSNRVGLVLELVPKDSKVKPPAVPEFEITATGITMRGFNSTSGASLLIDTEGSSGSRISMGVPSGGAKAQIVVTDATGKKVAHYAVPNSQPTTSVHIVPDGMQEPLTYTISLPTRTTEITIPFEFKDLPIEQ